MGAALFLWGQHYLTGIDEIDHQHEEISVILNQLHEARRVPAPRQKQREIFDSLINAVVEHFKAEETLMRMRHYEEFDSHKQQHDELVSKVSVMRKQFESGRDSVLDDGLEVMKDWLRDHLITSDRRMGRALCLK